MRRFLRAVAIATFILPTIFFVTPAHASPDDYLIWYYEQYNGNGSALMVVWLYKMTEVDPGYDFYIVKMRIVGLTSNGLHYVRGDVWSNGVCNDWEPSSQVYYVDTGLSLSVGGVGFGITVPAGSVGTTGGFMPTFGWQVRTTFGSPDKEFISVWYVPDGDDFAFLAGGSEWYDPIDPYVPPFCTDAIYVYYPYTFGFHKLTIATAGSGTTSPVPSIYEYYPSGFYASVWARPYSGQNFVKWVLDGSDSYTSPIRVLMTGDHALTAYFSGAPPQPPPGGGGGGCPYVSTWNGTQWLLDNNLIPGAEYSNGTDITDFYKLQQPLALEKGKYSLKIWDLDKHSFLDQVKLLAVDHESDVNIAVSPYGEILTYKNPAPLTTAIDQDNQDVSSILSTVDDNYYEGNAGDTILIDFGNLDVSKGAKLVLRTDYCPFPCKVPYSIHILSANGSWIDVASVIPRMYWSTDIVDLSNYLPDGKGEVKLKLYFTATHKIDYVGMDTTKQGEFELSYASLVTAIHNQIGDVKEQLQNSDNLRVEFLPGDYVTLKFTAPQLKEEKRDFMIILEGHYFIIS